MKKILSMVMAAAMVASLVPTNAFAANNPKGDVPATVKVLGATDDVQADNFEGAVKKGPELQLKVGKTSYTTDEQGAGLEYRFTMTLDNAKFSKKKTPEIQIHKDAGSTNYTLRSTAWNKGNNDKIEEEVTDGPGYKVTMERVADDEIEVTLKADGSAQNFEEDDTITVQLGADGRDKDAQLEAGATEMKKYSDGKSASVAVKSKDFKLSNSGTDLTYIKVGSKNLKVSVKETVDIAEDDVKTLKNVVIEPAVGDTFANMFKDGDKIRVRVSNSFEFKKTGDVTIREDQQKADAASDENELVFIWKSAWNSRDRLTLENIVLDSKKAKSGAVATLKIYAPGCDTVSVEVAKVIASNVTLSVDKDKDVPVIYSGVNVKNDGITNDSDHMSLEVTLKEASAGVWNTKKDFSLKLPKGVYVVGDARDAVSVKTHDNVVINGRDGVADIQNWFREAYKEGDYQNFDFDKRTLEETNPKNNDDAIELSFKLQLVADPNFTGNVELTLEGAAVETQKVTIAKFVKPYTVEAKQNDLSIDYRNTKIPTDIVVKEAEAGLWDKRTRITLSMDKIEFDEKGTASVDKKSGLKLKDDKVRKNGDNAIYFEVDTMSGDEPAVVTITGMELYMQRSLPAGAYDLEAVANTMYGTHREGANSNNGYVAERVLSPDNKVIADVNEDFVDFVEKAGFITITTAGREGADSFVTKVVVPIGGKTITAGGSTIDVETPAYINAAGYTMLPLRAVAVALGIPNTSVIWNGEARSITIMYGSKVISMTIGQKTMYVNGSPVAMSAAPEITGARTFLPFRDLGTALGVSDITFEKDPATSKVTTVYFNAGK